MEYGSKLLGLMIMMGLWTPVAMGGMPEQAIAQETNTDAAARLAEGDRLLEQGTQQFNMSQLQEALQSFQAALEFYRDSTVQASFPQESRQGEGRTIRGLGNVFAAEGQDEQALVFYRQALEIARQVGDRLGEGRALNNLGNSYNAQEQYEQAIELYSQALEIAREIEDHFGEIIALQNLANVYSSLGQYERAIEVHQQRLEIARELGDRAEEGSASWDLGSAYATLGHYERAIEFHQRHLTIARGLGDRSAEEIALGNLGAAYDSLGQYSVAIDFYQQTLVIVRETGDRSREASILGSLGNAYYTLTQYELAIDFYEQYLEITREIKNRAWESNALGNLGIAYDRLGQYETAIALHEQYLAIAREIGDLQGVAFALGNLGNAYAALEQYQEAIARYEQQLVITREIGDRAGEGRALGSLGIAYRNLGQYQEAIARYEQQLVITREIGDRVGEGRALGNLGVAYNYLGRYQKAISFHEQSLVIAREIGDREKEGIVLNNLGLAYENLGQYQRVIEIYEEQLLIAQTANNRQQQGTALGALADVYRTLGDYERSLEYAEQQLALAQELGNLPMQFSAIVKVTEAEAVVFEPDLSDLSLQNIHKITAYYQKMISSYQEALALFDRHLPILENLQHANGTQLIAQEEIETYTQIRFFLENALRETQKILAQYEELAVQTGGGTSFSDAVDDIRNRTQQLASIWGLRGIAFFQEGLAFARQSGNRFREAEALGSLGDSYHRLDQPQQAIEFYKQQLAVVRNINDVAKEGIALSNIGQVLSDQRLPEIAIVFLKASVQIRESIRGNLSELDAELQQSYANVIADDYRLLAELLLQQDRVLEAQEVLDLLKLQELDDYQLRDVRGTEETREGLSFWQAEQEILDLFNEYLQVEDGQSFQAFIERPEIQDLVSQLQRNARGQNLNPEQLARLQDNLQQAGNAALLYPLILDDRLELVLVTTDGLVRRTVPVSRVELNRVIADFRSDITNRFSDPIPNAQQLYDWLIAPLADDMDAAGAETVLYAADGALRYIPLAALHDGEQWLTQRYIVNHITAASLMDFSQAGATTLNILAGAFPEHDLPVQIGQEQVRFSGLPYAQVEVRTLSENLPNTQAFFSADFNREEIEPRLDQHTVLHLATHGQFRSGHPNDSFILLGDGDRITLFDLDQWDLPNVDLVVLSACETAVSGPELGSGEEILGFGYQVQRTGARAAISSLWSVSDGGTQILMNSFYGAVQEGLPKAAALQAAQEALITGDFTAVGGWRADVEIRSAQGSGAGDLLTHPYYWAPFILIGNGL